MSLHEILGFMYKLSAFMAVKHKDIDSFVKDIHSSNSARQPNGRSLIPSNISQSFKLVIFELKERHICGALHNVLVMQ